MLRIGDKLQAINGDTIVDHTTKGKIYEITDTFQQFFKIKNDKGDNVLPISTKFKQI